MNMANIPHGYDENGVRSGNGEWKQFRVHEEDIEGRIIQDGWFLDLTDDGDGDYDKGEIVLDKVGEDIKQIVIDILEDNGIEVI
jgi:hypothetical protein